METADAVEKQKTVFPQHLAKRLLAFRTVSTGPAAVNQQTTKPDTSLATKTGHFHLLSTGRPRGFTAVRKGGDAHNRLANRGPDVASDETSQCREKMENEDGEGAHMGRSRLAL